MNTVKVVSDLKQYIGYVSSKLELKGSNLILFLKKGYADDTSSVRVVFNDVLSFEDTGFIGAPMLYYDIGLPGFKNQYLCREKGLNPEDYRQTVFITEMENRKVELIITCREVEIVLSTDVSI